MRECLGTNPAGDGAADDDVILSCPAMQQELKGRQQSHEDGNAAPPADGCERLRQERRKDKRLLGALETLEKFRRLARPK